MSNKQTPVKSHLLALKKWLTIPDAARHLSFILKEEVTDADVLRLALDGRLKLSVYFVNHAQAICGKVVPYEDAVWWESHLLGFMKSGKKIPDKAKGNPQETKKFIDQFPPLPLMKSLDLGGGRYLNLDENVTTIRGVWDLSMIGNEQIEIEHEYQMLTGGPEVTLIGLDGAFVEREDGVMCQLQESMDENEYQSGSAAQLEKIKEHIASNNIEEEKAKELLNQHKKNREKYLNERIKNNYAHDYTPSGGLPSDSVLVVRTQALIDLQEKLYPEESMKGKSLEAPADYEAEHPEQSNSDLSSLRVSTDETSETRDPDTFISCLQVSYLDNTEIKIQYKGKRMNYTSQSIGFRDSKTKAWETFLEILQSKDHFYKLGPANYYDERLRKMVPIKEYSRRKALLKEINKKLLCFLSKQYVVVFPPRFKLYELQPTQGDGVYLFLFQIPLDKPSYKTKDQALRLLETLIQEEASNEKIQQATEIAMEAGANEDEVFKIVKDRLTSQQKYSETADEPEDGDEYKEE